ncbi:hypothetical protein [Flavobacterium sp.]|uniref:hypothetical protein n=1 Tax=Flavobacterium sp. TaxID=239 RepID=UPI003526D53B
MKFQFTILFLCAVLFVSAQVDSEKKVYEFKLDNPFETKQADNANLPTIEYKSILDRNDVPSRYSITKKKETPQKSILDTSTDLQNIGDEIKNKLNNEIAKEGSWNDVYFGKFVVNTATIKIKARDFADPDGDRVRFYLNNSTMYNNELLESYFKTYVINLNQGDNLVAIMALNTGLAGPNTAFFAIYDENDNLITSNEWNLKTGVSAKFTIEYKKGL